MNIDYANPCHSSAASCEVQEVAAVFEQLQFYLHYRPNVALNHFTSSVNEKKLKASANNISRYILSLITTIPIITRRVLTTNCSTGDRES